ncbi:MAG: alkyl sulfatase dimerization domain-containing protein [Ottowia sp.]|uniref:alkyl sulfatase dimerization domain-containing protein n=1 Tax=Ottowia sp. TaxID=1898956 RepID=UPI0039E2724B
MKHPDTLMAAAAADAGEMANYPMHYMGAPVAMTTAPNGAVIGEKAFHARRAVGYHALTVEQVAEGVWLVGGYSIANTAVIEAPEGLIVYDTGSDREEGLRLRAIIEEQISRKPVRAVIYSHSHYVHGTGALVDDAAQVPVYGHPLLNGSMGGSGFAAIPELLPVLMARLLVQFGNFLPDEGEDAALGARITKKGTDAFLPVTRPVQNGETVRVAGMDLQFFTEHVSDDHNVTVWLPKQKVVLNNFFWPGTPNLYTMRGAIYRDPQVWRDGLRVIRDLQPEHLLNTHARTISGARQVQEALTRYMDLITLTYDQTLRGILRGLGAEELRHFIYQPRALSEPYYNAQTYGETPWFPPAIYQYQMGWYNGDATELMRLPPGESSARLVALMGGADQVVAAAQTAFDKKEYAWAAELVQHVCRIDPDHAAARALKVRALRVLGQVSPSSIGRAFCLSAARALEGRENVPIAVPPAPGLVTADPARYVNMFRVRIDPRRGEHVDKVLSFRFGDKAAGLHVRNGIVEFLPEPAQYLRQADIALAMDAAVWERLYLDPAEFAALAQSGQVRVTTGSVEEAAAVFALFDRLGAA